MKKGLMFSFWGFMLLLASCGGSSSSTAQEDTTPPVITILGDSVVNISQGTLYDDAGASAYDDVDGDVNLSVYNGVHIDTVGTYSVTYTAIDASGNMATATRTVNVIAFYDVVKPLITIAGEEVLTILKDSNYTDAGASAYDSVDGTLSVTVNNTVDTSTAGSYSVVYTAVDAAGNVATATRTVHVIDTYDVEPPVITILGKSIVNVTLGTLYLDLGAMAQDAYGEATITVDNPVDTSTAGIYTITYTAMDTAGNTATATRTVQVVDPSLSITRQFIDAAVEGLGYKCLTSNLSGTTNSDGEFSCEVGDGAVAFYIGSDLLGYVEGSDLSSGVISPWKIVATQGADKNETYSINIAQLLQSMDSDANPSNGITLSNSNIQIAIDADLVSLLSSESFDSALSLAFASSYVDNATAIAHLVNALIAIEGAPTYITDSCSATQSAGMIYIPGGFDVDGDGVDESGFWITPYPASVTETNLSSVVYTNFNTMIENNFNLLNGSDFNYTTGTVSHSITLSMPQFIDQGSDSNSYMSTYYAMDIPKVMASANIAACVVNSTSYGTTLPTNKQYLHIMQLLEASDDGMTIQNNLLGYDANVPVEYEANIYYVGDFREYTRDIVTVEGFSAPSFWSVNNITTQTVVGEIPLTSWVDIDIGFGYPGWFDPMAIVIRQGYDIDLSYSVGSGDTRLGSKVLFRVATPYLP